MQRQIERLEDHFIVCGFGRMGTIVCKELAARPVPFVVIERDPVVAQRVEEAGYLVINGDSTEEAVLTGAGIDRARGLVAALPSDADNVYAVLTARELNHKMIIVARAEDEATERKLMRAGATQVVSPYVIGGHRMANAVLRPGVLDVLDLATHYRSLELQIEELTVTAAGVATNRTLQDSGLRERHQVIVIAIRKASGEMIFKPLPDDKIEVGDRLIVMGQTTDLRELERQV